MTVATWALLIATITWTLVLFIHIERLHRAWRSEDDVRIRAMIQTTMRLVGIWQIILGATIAVMNAELEQGNWISPITLWGSGVAILLADWVKRKFEAVT